MGAVKRRALDADAVQRRLDDGVLLGVNRPAQLVMGAALQVLASAAHPVAVVEPGGRAVVARGEDALVLDEDCSNLISQAGGALGDYCGDLHEVLVESWTMNSETHLCFLA